MDDKLSFYKFAFVLDQWDGCELKYIIEKIFPNSNIKQHLLDKLIYYATDVKGNYQLMKGLIVLYLKLDKPHQKQFDDWFNQQFERYKLNTEIETT